MGRGVHAGELLGIPATNKEVETEGIAIHRVRDGKIVEYWSVSDVARVLQQVGVLPGPPAQGCGGNAAACRAAKSGTTERLRGRTRTLDSHASRLRRKLAAVSARPWVVNQWGVGYRLVEPE